MSDNIKKSIFTHLAGDSEVSALVVARIFPQITATSTELPYIVYERSSSQQIQHMGGLSDIRSDDFTFIMYAQTQLEVEDLTREVQSSLNYLRRTTVSNIEFIAAFENSESDDTDYRGVASEIPAFSEVITFTFWYRPA